VIARPHLRRRARIAALVGAAVVLAAAPSAAGQSPPALGLAGEFVFSSPTNPSATLEVRSQCKPDGNAIISYRASGEAIGPYPGTFWETGVATLGPANSVGISPLRHFAAAFAITSPAGDVTGTKTAHGPGTIPESPPDEPPPQPANAGQCVPNAFPGPGQPVTLRALAINEACYHAEIRTRAGAHTDRGSSNVNLAASIFGPGEDPGGFFGELFRMPEPTEPC
jgi:hypothetical protein